MVCKTPLVSIGIPVFNGDKYLAQALDSILAQTYQNFEVIISDNASTDQTQKICRVYCAKDNRIRYYRNKKNIGAVRNFNRVFELSMGKYFKWAASDDVIASSFLAKSVRVLNQESSVVLCHSKTGRIDEAGLIMGDYEKAKIIDSDKAHIRFGDAIHCDNIWMVFGLMRADILKKTSLLGGYVNSDGNLIAELSLFGRIFEIPECLFYRRSHMNTYTTKYYELGPVALPNYKKQLAWWKGTEKKGLQVVLPHWRKCLEYCKSVKRSPLNFAERLLCYQQIVRWFIRDGQRLMRWDLAVALAYIRLNLISNKLYNECNLIKYAQK